MSLMYCAGLIVVGLYTLVFQVNKEDFYARAYTHQRKTVVFMNLQSSGTFVLKLYNMYFHFLWNTFSFCIYLIVTIIYLFPRKN